MQENFIEIRKKARYYLIGENNTSIKTIWFVLHGYGQLAKYFINQFKVLDNGENLVVAPEGLSRFYLTGFTGRIGASWMTKEAREHEIDDYIDYLNAVYDEITDRFHGNYNITVLGFSQGVATACRWFNHRKAKISRLILWAGFIPNEFHNPDGLTDFNQHDLNLVYGLRDEFLNQKDIEEYKQLLNNNNVTYNLMTFDGKHEINQEILMKLLNNETS